MLSKSSRARDGLRFLFKDDTTKYNSFFFMCANYIPFTSYKIFVNFFDINNNVKNINLILNYNILTKKGVNLYSLSSLKEFVMPTRSKNMSCVVVNLQFSISSLTV
jgi:hypothetical protein